MTPLAIARVAFGLSLLSAATGVAQGNRPAPPGARLQVAASAARLQLYTLHDSAYGRPRRVWIYLPPGYDSTAAAPYPLIVAFDGEEYRDTMPLPLVLDTLLAGHHAPAFVGVLVDDSSSSVRIADLANAPRMVDFLGRQLIPWFVPNGM